MYGCVRSLNNRSISFFLKFQGFLFLIQLQCCRI
nr:MAG TPA: hypothetical protein [Caudoviricetes sp.]